MATIDQLNVTGIKKSYVGELTPALDFEATPIIGKAPLLVDFIDILLTVEDYRIQKVYRTTPHTNLIIKTY